ncbi:MAG: NAD(P)H-binding protein, partial [Bacteroidia bacterium]
MNVIITGSTGMVGSILLDLCRQSSQISKVTTLIRKQNSIEQNEKINTVVIKDFKTYDYHLEFFQNADVVFFCLGVYTGQVPKDLFKEITVDYAVNCAKLLAEQNPKARFCLLSGAGADRTEKSRTAFAKFKGMAENQISETNLEFYSFRPGYIYPVEPREEPSFMY